MGSAESVLASAIITQVLYELRDPNGYVYNKDGAFAELLGYINRCLELIYEILLDKESEIIYTGTGTITTVAGTQNYDLSANTMGDFWAPRKLRRNRYSVWISTLDPMDMCEEDDLFDAINANEGSTTSRAQPDRFCILGDYIWFEFVPDQAYTVNLKYYPNFVKLAAVTSAMPYKNLFNNDVVEGVKLFAKHRNERSFNAEAILKDRFTQRALRVERRRRRRDVGFRPKTGARTKSNRDLT